MLRGEIAKQARSELRQLVVQKSREAADLRSRVLEKYRDAIAEGKTDGQAQAWVLECFDRRGLTERRLHNILKRAKDFGNPKINAYSDAKMTLYLQKLEIDIEEIRDQCDEVLDKLDEMEIGQDETYPTEVVKVLGCKGESVTTKSLPISEARYMVLKRKADAHDKFFDAIKALRVGSGLFEGATVFANVTFNDMKARINELQKQNKISDGVVIGPEYQETVQSG